MLPQLAEDCAEILGQKNGLDAVIEVVAGSLPEHLRETAYALACDIAAADGHVSQEEARLLEMLRHEMDIDRLVAAGIERGARAHYQRI